MAAADRNCDMDMSIVGVNVVDHYVALKVVPGN